MSKSLVMLAIWGSTMMINNEDIRITTVDTSTVDVHRWRAGPTVFYMWDTRYPEELLFKVFHAQLYGTEGPQPIHFENFERYRYDSMEMDLANGREKMYNVKSPILASFDAALMVYPHHRYKEAWRKIEGLPVLGDLEYSVQKVNRFVYTMEDGWTYSWDEDSGKVIITLPSGHTFTFFPEEEGTELSDESVASAVETYHNEWKSILESRVPKENHV